MDVHYRDGARPVWPGAAHPDDKKEHQAISWSLPPCVSLNRCLGAYTLNRHSHHHVESVHFTATGGQFLHPALAIIQTPAREYFILRDNGMQVGCEEDGVVEMWRKVLGCDASGRAVQGDERITLATVTNPMR